MRRLRRALRNVARSPYTDVHPRAVGGAEPRCCGCHAPRVPTRARVARDKLTAAACGKGASLGSADRIADATSSCVRRVSQSQATQRLSSCEPVALACEASAPADVVAVTPAPLLVHSTACVAPAVMATRAPWASGGANVPSAPLPQPEPAVLAALHSRGGELLPDQQGVRVQGWRVQSTQRPIMGRDELHRCVCLRLNPHVRC